MKKVIDYPENINFASEVMDKIPYGYINKTVCGIGMTCVALENNQNVIIAVPTIYLAFNKTKQYPNNRYKGKILLVYGKTTMNEILEYVNTTQIIKIMCTYDSLAKVKFLLDNCDLVIDESNELLSRSKLKPKVIHTLFEIAKEYRYKVSFVSATPISIEYMPDWIAELDQITFNWAGMVNVKTILCERRYPYKAFRDEFGYQLYKNKVAYAGNRSFTKAIVFINSVQEIVKLIKEIGVDKKDCAIICGENNKNDLKISNIPRLETYNNLPMFTFITSSGFCGIDLYDTDAMTFVLSNINKDHTMIDIMTDLKQASSRQRCKNNVNYGTFVYIYNQSYFKQSKIDLENLIKENYIYVSNCLKLWELGKVEDDINKAFERMSSTNPLFTNYTIKNDITGEYSINDFCFKADEYFLKEIHEQYRKGFNIKSNFNNHELLEEIIIDKPIIYSYADLVDYFYEHNVNGIVSDWGIHKDKTEWINIIEINFKLNRSVDKNYTRAKKLIQNLDNDYNQLVLAVYKYIKEGKSYTKDFIKVTLNNVYIGMGLIKKAKSVDIYEFYDTKEITVKGVIQVLMLRKKISI